MGHIYHSWQARTNEKPRRYDEALDLIRANRHFHEIENLKYNSPHLDEVIAIIKQGLRQNKRIALYADYDVDGTMSCISWIWFLREIQYKNFCHYIPCRFKEGYGVNLNAIKHLIDEQKADIIITMDTGITANEEAAYCKQRGVTFICTDHHKIQPEKMPDCLIVNPKMQPDPLYQELCGCGITFVLLRKLAEEFSVKPALWLDLLALAGMATICDVVPMNPVNHRLARLGIESLTKSQRPILRQLLQATKNDDHADEKDVGFRLGPRINAVGRLHHADKVIEAFVDEDPRALILYMTRCNEERKKIQQQIYHEARLLALQQQQDPLLFLGGDWHPGVVGIVASRLAEEFWRPVWIFNNQSDIAKGSARSISGFDVTEAMLGAKEHFIKFGGHHAAGGFTFSRDKSTALQHELCHYAEAIRQAQPELWQSRIDYDFELPENLADLELAQALANLKPYGHGFAEPKFMLEADIVQVRYYQDKSTGKDKHTALTINVGSRQEKIMFFNQVHRDLKSTQRARFILSLNHQVFRGQQQLSLHGIDYDLRS